MESQVDYLVSTDSLVRKLREAGRDAWQVLEWVRGAAATAGDRRPPWYLVQRVYLKKAWAPGVPIVRSADTGYCGGMTVGIGGFSYEVQVDTSSYWPRQGDLIAGTTVIITAKGQSVSYSVKEGFTALLTNNNITGCTGEGILVGATGNSTARVKYDGNRTLGNQPNTGFRAFASGGNLCAVLQNNTSDRFLLSNLAVELFAAFGTRNTGTVLNLGNITDVAAGTCGLP